MRNFKVKVIEEFPSYTIDSDGVVRNKTGRPLKVNNGMVIFTINDEGNRCYKKRSLAKLMRIYSFPTDENDVEAIDISEEPLKKYSLGSKYPLYYIDELMGVFNRRTGNMISAVKGRPYSVILTLANGARTTVNVKVLLEKAMTTADVLAAEEAMYKNNKSNLV